MYEPNNIDSAPGAVATAEAVQDTDELQGERNMAQQSKAYYAITGEFNEVDDQNSLYKTVPATAVSEYPNPKNIVKSLTELDSSFNFNDGFGEIEYKVDENYYLVSTTWLRTFLDAVGECGGWEDQGVEKPFSVILQVNNDSLFESAKRKKLKKQLRFKSHFVSVSEDVWKQLINWFGGGPEVSRKGYKKNGARKVLIDTEGKTIKVVSSLDMTKFRRLNFPSHATVKEVKDQLCEIFKMDPNKTRLYDYFQKKPHARLDIESGMSIPISEKNLIEDNLVLLEAEKEDGTYLISKVGVGGYSGGIGTFHMDMDDSLTGTSPDVIGAVGLRNIGNTCYMNSTLQCLSNIPVLKSYFVTNKYATDINRDNPLGYSGRLADAFAGVLKKLWQNEASICVPHGFKRVLGELKQEFQGMEQHDSQELLSQVLDGLHEDLNRVKNKPYIEQVQGNGRPDAEVAEEAMVTHKLRNDSYINDLFTGLLKSTVTCPDVTCNNVSITFDPYMILPLPLQVAEKHYQVLSVVYVPMDESLEIRRVNVVAPKHGPIFILNQLIMQQVGITEKNEEQIRAFNEGRIASHLGLSPEDPSQVYHPDDYENVGMRSIILARLKGSVVGRYFRDAEDLSGVSSSYCLVAYEVFNESKFADFCAVGHFDSIGWLRSLHFKRQYLNKTKRALENEEPDSNTDSEDDYKSPHRLKKLQDEENIGSNENGGENLEEDQIDLNLVDTTKEQIVCGYENCPYVAGDIWNGSFVFDDTEQYLRIEVVSIEKLTREQFRKQRDQLREQGSHSDEALMTDDDIAASDFFLVQCICDTKENMPPYMQARMRFITESAFQMKGIFITSVVNEEVAVETPVAVTATSNRSQNDTSIKGNKEKRNSVPKKGLDQPKKSATSFWSRATKGGNKKTDASASTKKVKKTLFSKGSVKSEVNVVNGTDKEKDRKESTAGTTNLKSLEPNGVKQEKEEVSQENSTQKMVKLAESLKPGSLENQFYGGKCSFSPVGDAKKFRRQIDLPQNRNYGRRIGPDYDYAPAEDDQARETLIFIAVIDNGHKYMWGKVNNQLGHRKGEFFAQRWESKQWKSNKVELQKKPFGFEKNTVVAQPSSRPSSVNPKRERQTPVRDANPAKDTVSYELLAQYRDPVSLSGDDRVLILAVHRVERETSHYSVGKSQQFVSIPHMLFMHHRATEGELVSLMRNKFKIYLDKHNQQLQQLRPGIDPTDLWKPEEMFKHFKLVRGNSRFDTKESNDPLNVGEVIEEHSDKPLLVQQDSYYIWVVIDWNLDQIPFESVRSGRILDPPASTEPAMNLTTALELFSRTEKLNALNSWYCSKCKSHQEAFKQLQIWSLPPILLVQFKRFSQDEGRSLADKLEIPVEFPLELDMKQYALSCQVVKNNTNLSVDEVTQKMREYEYDLVAVTSHIGGGLGEGHYVASVRNEVNGNWYHYNDSFVNKVDPKVAGAVTDPMAYVVFYMRRTLRPASWEITGQGEIIKT